MEWDKLPTRFLTGVVEKLDFRTRCRLRHVSKSTLSLVDSVPLFLPRVGIYANKRGALFQVFTGIDVSISVEVVAMGGGREHHHIVRRQKAGKQRRQSTKRIVDPSGTPTLAVIKMLQPVLCHPETVLGGFDLFLKPSAECALKIDELLGEHTKIRTRIVRHDYEMGIAWPFITRIVESDLRELQFCAMAPISQYTALNVHTYRSSQSMLRYKMHSFIDTYHADDGTGETKAICSEDFCYLREKCTDSRNFIRKYAKGKRIVKIGANEFATTFIDFLGAKIMIRARNGCGAVAYGISHNQQTAENFAVYCPLRYACARHADPFDHWFYWIRKPDDHFSYMEYHEFFDEETVIGRFNGVNNVKRKYQEYMKLAREQMPRGHKDKASASYLEMFLQKLGVH